MKIIGIDNNYIPLEEGREMPSMYLMADSSMLHKGNPFFIPKFDSGFGFVASIALRIGRLGKCISTRFAHRYVDAVAIGINMRGVGLLESLRAKGLPWTEAVAFDGCVITTPFFPVEAIPCPLGFDVSLNGNVAISWNSESMKRNIAETIAFASRYFTLKTGDIIFAALSNIPVMVKRNDRISAAFHDDLFPVDNWGVNIK